ncbi:MAG: hypothetical protein ACOCV1_00070 [Bacillota bacterium]
MKKTTKYIMRGILKFPETIGDIILDNVVVEAYSKKQAPIKLAYKLSGEKGIIPAFTMKAFKRSNIKIWQK